MLKILVDKSLSEYLSKHGKSHGLPALYQLIVKDLICENSENEHFSQTFGLSLLYIWYSVDKPNSDILLCVI